MTAKIRCFLFIMLLCVIAVVSRGQENDIGQKHRITWSKDRYALRYEVLIEKEGESGRGFFLREFTEETFILVLLPPGNYRLRIISYDVRGVAGRGTEWKELKVPEPQAPLLVKDEEPSRELENDTAREEKITETVTQVDNLTEEKVPPEILTQSDEFAEDAAPINDEPKRAPPVKRRNLYIGLFAEGSGYTRYKSGFGGGLTIGGSFNGIGAGVNFMYAQDNEKYIFMEALAHFRYYLPFFKSAKNNTGLFLQADGGIVLFAYDKPEISGYKSFSGGLGAGWRFPLGQYFYLEPRVRGGYPYLFGASITAGIRFLNN